MTVERAGLAQLIDALVQISDRCFCLLKQIVELAAVIILERGAHSLQGKKALKPGRLRLPQRLKSNLEIVWHIALPGSPVFQTPFQHAAVLRSDSIYHARLSTAD